MLHQSLSVGETWGSRGSKVRESQLSQRARGGAALGYSGDAVHTGMGPLNVEYSTKHKHLEDFSGASHHLLTCLNSESICLEKQLPLVAAYISCICDE